MSPLTANRCFPLKLVSRVPFAEAMAAAPLERTVAATKLASLEGCFLSTLLLPCAAKTGAARNREVSNSIAIHGMLSWPSRVKPAREQTQRSHLASGSGVYICIYIYNPFPLILKGAPAHTLRIANVFFIIRGIVYLTCSFCLMNMSMMTMMILMTLMMMTVTMRSSSSTSSGSSSSSSTTTTTSSS